jgi:hypothetical protein
MTKRIRVPNRGIHKNDDGRHSSRVSTGRDLLPFEDGRSVWARIMRSTLNSLIAHCGGEDIISDTRVMACRRVAALEAELVSHEDRIASIRRKGKEPPASLLMTYGMLADRQRRLSEAIGWDRHAKAIKDITLEDHIRAKAQGKANTNGHFKRGPRSPVIIDHEA